MSGRERIERAVAAIEERTGLRALWRWLADEELPGGARWAYVFGSVLAALLGMQLLTGIALATDYAPTVDAAHASVQRIMDPEQAPFGAIVRALHHHGASFLVVLLAAHLLQVAWTGAYRRPREANWLTGLALAGVLLAFAFTGYLLPWDQTAYYATRVGLNITASTPIAGPKIAALLQGGPVMGNLTLTRFYVIHIVVLPSLLVILFAVHLALFRRRGVTPVVGRDGQVAPRREPFWPNQAAKDAVAFLVIMAGLVALAWWRGAPLGEKADPSAPFEARPEWYFLWLFQLLHVFEPPWDWVGTMGIPGAIAAFLVLLPWIDRSRDRRPSRRKLPILGVAAVLSLIGSLTAWVFIADATRAEAPEDARSPEVTRKAGPVVGPLEAGMLFGWKCTECHAINGAPDDPDAPDFRDPEFARSGRQDIGRLMKAVKEGGDIMPPFEDELTDAQIRAILEQVVLRFADEAAKQGPAIAPTKAPPSPPSPAQASPEGSSAPDAGGGAPP